MSKVNFVRGGSLASIAAIMLGATALSESALAQDRGGFDLHNHVAQNFTTDNRRGGGGGGGGETQQAKDPGPRGGDPGAGGPISTLSPDELAFFTAATDVFNEVEQV